MRGMQPTIISASAKHARENHRVSDATREDPADAGGVERVTLSILAY